jgi:hypothetical protein
MGPPRWRRRKTCGSGLSTMPERLVPTWVLHRVPSPTAMSGDCLRRVKPQERPKQNLLRISPGPHHDNGKMSFYRRSDSANVLPSTTVCMGAHAFGSCRHRGMQGLRFKHSSVRSIRRPSKSPLVSSAVAGTTIRNTETSFAERDSASNRMYFRGRHSYTPPPQTRHFRSGEYHEQDGRNASCPSNSV